MTADTLLTRDIPLWKDAKTFLDVRSNDVHTRISYRLARALLAEDVRVDETTVLPAILLHDVGWKRIDPALLRDAVGPNATRPDLVREHEVHGVQIAGEILRRHRPVGVDVDAVLTIIERHDTLKDATSSEDAVRSEERRVGKECRSRRSPWGEQQKERHNPRTTVRTAIAQRPRTMIRKRLHKIE